MISPPVGAWEAIGVSRAMAGKPVCQDSHVIEHLDGGAVAIAVADGAGSAAHAEVGSSVAARAAAASLKAAWERAAVCASDTCDPAEAVRAAVTAARAAVEAEAKRMRVTPRDLSTTLVVVLACGSGAAAAQVGDCMAIAELEDGAALALTIPMRGEYVNETTMLTSADALEQMQVYVTSDPVKCVAATTDGLLPVCTVMPFHRPFAATFRRLFGFAATWDDRTRAAAELDGFLASDRIQSATGDDLTLVLARRV